MVVQRRQDGAMTARALVLCASALAAACSVPPPRGPAPAAVVAAPDAPLDPFSTGAPFLGISVADEPPGVRVAHVVAGPAAQAGIRRGDRLRAAAGGVLDRAAFEQHVRAALPYPS